MEIPSAEAALSAIDALMGLVTPNLRRVTLYLNEDGLALCFFYQGEISKIERSIVYKAVSRMKKSTVGVIGYAEQLDYPAKPVHRGRIIYVRYEPTPPEFLYQEYGPSTEAVS